MRLLKMKKLNKGSVKWIAAIVVFAILFVYVSPSLLQITGTTNVRYINDMSQLSATERILLTPMMTTSQEFAPHPDPETSPLYHGPNKFVYPREYGPYTIQYAPASGQQTTATIEVSTYISGVDLMRGFTVTPVTACADYVSGLPDNLYNELISTSVDFCTFMFQGSAECVVQTNSEGWRLYNGEYKFAGPGNYNPYLYDDAFMAVGKSHVYISAYGDIGAGIWYHSIYGDMQDKVSAHITTDYSSGSNLKRTVHILEPDTKYTEFYFCYPPECIVHAAEYAHTPQEWNELDQATVLDLAHTGNSYTYTLDTYYNGWEFVNVNGYDYLIQKLTPDEEDCICNIGETVCYGNQLHKCSDDGKQILYIDCVDCQNGVCTEGWVDVSCPMISQGFRTYEAMTISQIKKTTHLLTIGNIPTLFYGQEFDIPIVAGTLTTQLPITVVFRDSSGQEIETYYDSTPDAHINSCPLTSDGSISITVESDGETQGTVKSIYVLEPTITATFPQNCYKGQDIEVAVDVAGVSEACGLTIEYFDPYGALVDTFYGNEPIVYVVYPLATDGTMTITADHSGGSTSKTYNLQTSELHLIISEPDRYITSETFSLGVTFTDSTVSVPIIVRINDGTYDVTYNGAMPSITIDDPQFKDATTITVTATHLGDTYSKVLSVDFEELTIIIEGGTFRYGVSTTMTAYIHQYPSISADITATITKNSVELGRYYGVTPSVTLTMPKAIGNCQIEIFIDYQEGYYGTRNVFFDGSGAIITQARTDEGTQYEMNPIIYYIDVVDNNGDYLTPTIISNIQPICTLSLGTVDSSSYRFLGDGTYEVTSQVTGVGNFIGYITFDYLDEEFTSKAISIEILENKLNIGTSDIPGYATRNEYFEIYIDVFNPYNQPVDPTTMEVLIRYPDGDTTETILFGQLQRVSEGRFRFSYMPTQLELYTFEITAEKTGVTSAFAIAFVAVNAEGVDPDSGSDIFDMILGLIMQYWWIIVVIFVGIIIALWKFVI